MTRTRTARLAALTAPAVLVLSLTACGGSGAPEDASTADFCEAFNAEPSFDDEESLATASPEEQAEAIKTALDELADKLEEVGTPEGIPDDAREGFEISLDAARDLDQDEIQKAIEEEDSDIFDTAVEGDDKAKVDALDAYADETCADESEPSSNPT